MPIIIQETSVEMTPQQERGVSPNTMQEPQPAVVPLRPADVERVQRRLQERQARIHAD